ncbi:hypothetical protein TRICI_001974 [Trichomonascus ciferrii]|uniref:Restriction of telomere capping protein 5 n=1 Tax=Trichomonascus ciferrii TaxID=44093 RepID=A0A642V7W6_9ASCO|nr:hypothetical protein TRICI_001974 [Trichomonascus ciferrii]
MSIATYESAGYLNKQKKEKENVVVNDEDEEDEDLVMYSLEDVEAWDEFRVVRGLEGVDMGHYSVGARDMCRLVAFLLAFSNYLPHESVDLYIQSHVGTPRDFERYFARAIDVLRTMNPNITMETLDEHKISYGQFKPALDVTFPYLFGSLGRVFDQFLYATKDKKDSSALTEHVNSKLLHGPQMAQLCALLGHDQVYGKLMRLYMGSEMGYSMRSFESKVFKWAAPTLVIVSGTVVSPESDHSAMRKAFDQLIPPTRMLKGKKLTEGGLFRPGTRVVFGAVVDNPWKVSNKEAFGDGGCLLFQLSPMQDVYPPSRIKKNYAYFCNVSPGGVGFGSPPPKTVGSRTTYRCDNVSLTLEESFEYGTFRHLGGGGSFHQSMVHPQAEYEARFAITGLEVWGYGGKDDLDEQKKKWEWEEREAQYRQNVNIGNYEDNRALLEMAGLVGNHASSGGSV